MGSYHGHLGSRLSQDTCSLREKIINITIGLDILLGVFYTDTRTLVRSSGVSLILGGILLAVHHATHPLGETSQYVVSSLWVFSHAIGYVAWIFSLFGLIGLYARLAKNTGPMVLAGFVMTIIGGTTLYSAVLWAGAIFQPFLVSNSPALNNALVSFSSSPLLVPGLVGAVLFGVGYPIFGLATYRSNTMQRWVVWPAFMSVIALLLFLGASGVYVLGNIGGIVWGLSLTTWGYAILSERPTATTVSQFSQ